MGHANCACGRSKPTFCSRRATPRAQGSRCEPPSTSRGPCRSRAVTRSFSQRSKSAWQSSNELSLDDDGAAFARLGDRDLFAEGDVQREPFEVRPNPADRFVEAVLPPVTRPDDLE